jgi:hypothetical protein
VDIDKLRNYAEVIGIFAIVVSLLLLGFEVRQTRLAIMGATALTRAQMSLDADLAFIHSDHLAPALVKWSSEGFGALSRVEKERVTTDYLAAKSRYDAYYYQYELGLLDEEYYRYNLLPNISFFKPGWEEFDMLNEATTRPSFKAMVESAPDNNVLVPSIE